MAIKWALEKANTGRAATKQDGTLSYSVSPAVATYDAVFSGRYTIAASATQAVDFRSFTDLAGNAVTATKIYAVVVKVTGVNSAVKVEPHGTNPLAWFFAGTTPSITLPGSSTGAVFVFSEGGSETVSATVRQWLLTNTGSADATVDVVAIVGTT